MLEVAAVLADCRRPSASSARVRRRWPCRMLVMAGARQLNALLNPNK